MIDDLRAMAIFAETVRQGSFRGAAKVLRLSPSVVSYHITQLEKRLGLALIYRSTRKLSLTHDGRVLYQHALEMLSAAEQGLSQVSSSQSEPRGELVVTLPSGLVRDPISQRIAEFAKQYQGIELTVLYTDVTQDLIAGGIDIAFRAGDLEDSALKSKRIGTIERKLVCSAEYWALQKTPSHPQELADWDWIRLAMLPNHRTLVAANQQSATITYGSRVIVDSVEAMTQFCIFGLGLASPPDYLVDEAIEAGILVEVLPAWRMAPMPLYAVWPANVSDSSNSRRLLNYLGDSEDPSTLRA